MFKKIYEEISALSSLIKSNFRKQSNEHYETRDSIRNASDKVMSQLDKMSRIIDSQQRTIEQLTNALKDKYEHGLFVFSKDGKCPMVIKNGKEIMDERTTYFRITWADGEVPTIETEQVV